MDYCSPVGTLQERASGKIWPGNWKNVNGFARRYEIRPGVWTWHTGADLNWNEPGHFDLDAHAPIVSVALGVVRYVGWPAGSTSGNVIIIDYGEVVARYWHIEKPLVKAGDVVAAGQQIASVGNAGGWFPYHLHFDLSLQRFLITNPTDWPGTEAGVRAKYIDPEQWLREHVTGETMAERMTVTSDAVLPLVANPARPFLVKGAEVMGYERELIGEQVWRRVQLLDIEDDGWVLESDKNTINLVSSEPGEPHEVAVLKLNVRRGAGTNFSIVRAALKGEVLKVAGHYAGAGAREWARITDGALAGNYVARIDSVGTVCLVPKG